MKQIIAFDRDQLYAEDIPNWPPEKCPYGNLHASYVFQIDRINYLNDILSDIETLDNEIRIAEKARKGVPNGHESKALTLKLRLLTEIKINVDSLLCFASLLFQYNQAQKWPKID